MKAPNEKPEVKLVGADGNAFSVMGLVAKALKRAGADKEYVDKYMAEAMAGDYDHLLQVTIGYVEVS